MTDYNAMKNSELVDAYNAMVDTAGLRGIEVTQVKRFKDHSIGVERCTKLEERLENHGKAPPEPGQITETNDEVSEAATTPSASEGESDDMAAKKAKKSGAKKTAKKSAAKKRVAKVKVVKPPKSKFGHDKMITEVGACNRFKGSKAEKLYGSMARYMEKHPKATVADVIENTDYRRQDYNWDKDRGTIKVKNI